MESLIKKINSLKNEIGSIEERVTGNTQAIEQTNSLIRQLGAELREVRLLAALDPSEANLNTIANIRGRLDQSKADLEDMGILAEALTGRKVKLYFDLEELQQQSQQEEAERLAAKLPALISQYNKGMGLAFQSAVAAKSLVQQVMALGGKQFIHELDSRGFDKARVMSGVYVLADFKERCSEPRTLNIDHCSDKKNIIDALLN